MFVDKMRKTHGKKTNNGTWQQDKPSQIFKQTRRVEGLAQSQRYKKPEQHLVKQHKLDNRAANKMKTSFASLAICACVALATADVSHLPANSYLPPPKPEQVEHMTIEKHELRELPEQVEYMHESPLGQMELTPSDQLTPPAMPEEEQMLSSRYLSPPQAEQQPAQAEQLPAMPATRYLPPAQPAMPKAEQVPQMPATHYLPPLQSEQRAEPEQEPMAQPEMMAEPEPEQTMEYMQPIEQQKPQAAPAMHYLPPAQQPEPAQYQQYQQYQEQLQQEQQMPYILDVQQPMAPSDVEMQAYEPQPAHQLRDDGYHYRQAMEEQRLRH